MQICYGCKNVNSSHICAGVIFQGTLKGSAGLLCMSLIFSAEVCIESGKVLETSAHANHIWSSLKYTRVQKCNCSACINKSMMMIYRAGVEKRKKKEALHWMKSARNQWETRRASKQKGGRSGGQNKQQDIVSFNIYICKISDYPHQFHIILKWNYLKTITPEITFFLWIIDQK